MEVEQMKYEMPTCEIVVLDKEIVTTSIANRTNPNDSPLVPLG